MSKTSNTSPIVMKENLTGIFIDADYDRCQNMIKESEIIGINGRSVVLNAHICWHGEDLAYRLNDVFISLDFALELCGVSWENIVCVDLDIDGGEIFLLEDSKGLAKYKPPVIMLEFKKMHVLNDPNHKRLRKRRSGFDDFLYDVSHAVEMGYRPVCSWRDNLFVIAEEYLTSIKIPIVKSISELVQPTDTYYADRINGIRQYIIESVDYDE